jgi:N4-gp56 family major capsid protein
MAMDNANDTGTTQGLTQLLQTYYNDRAQDRLIINFVFYPLGMKKKLPKNSGQTFQFYRYNNIAGTTATINEDTLTAGLTLLSATTAAITVLQYGQFIVLSDFAVQSERSKDLLGDATDVLADAASDTVDKLIQNELSASATLFVGSAGTHTTASIVAGDLFLPTTLRVLGRNFRANKVRPFRDGKAYAAVLSPFQTFDLVSDTTVGGFASTAQYSQPDKIWNWEIGKLWNFRILESQNILTASVTSSVSATPAYAGYALGENSFASVDIEDSPIQMIVKGVGSGGTYDPYNNIATIAYKLRGFGVKYLGGDGPRAYKVITTTSA